MSYVLTQQTASGLGFSLKPPKFIRRAVSTVARVVSIAAPVLSFVPIVGPGLAKGVSAMVGKSKILTAAANIARVAAPVAAVANATQVGPKLTLLDRTVRAGSAVTRALARRPVLTAAAGAVAGSALLARRRRQTPAATAAPVRVAVVPAAAPAQPLTYAAAPISTPAPVSYPAQLVQPEPTSSGSPAAASAPGGLDMNGLLMAGLAVGGLVLATKAASHGKRG